MGELALVTEEEVLGGLFKFLRRLSVENFLIGEYCTLDLPELEFRYRFYTLFSLSDLKFVLMRRLIAALDSKY